MTTLVRKMTQSFQMLWRFLRHQDTAQHSHWLTYIGPITHPSLVRCRWVPIIRQSIFQTPSETHLQSVEALCTLCFGDFPFYQAFGQIPLKCANALDSQRSVEPMKQPTLENSTLREILNCGLLAQLDNSHGVSCTSAVTSPNPAFPLVVIH